MIHIRHLEANVLDPRFQRPMPCCTRLSFSSFVQSAKLLSAKATPAPASAVPAGVGDDSGGRAFGVAEGGTAAGATPSKQWRKRERLI